MRFLAVPGAGTLVVFAIDAVVFVLIAVAGVPRSSPRDPRRHEPLSPEELEDDVTD